MTNVQTQTSVDTEIERLQHELEVRAAHIEEMRPDPSLRETSPAAYDRAMHDMQAEQHAAHEIEARLLHLRWDAKPNE